ncbi:hypothetical protein [Lyngbya sp. PCC 8106]|uniref:hypothetical protein n=1 Tax=Lyngbya sp. (strain PCC 8106) TaxID=313612 RepID=UPI0000EAB114|nr:hypothetical protein [Lyngbya sp. PCC 8106]EAW39282.1 hypothetical protein L8106_05051 [Lyngbya sp. PCC 8106]
MKSITQKLTLFFAAGCLGGLVNSLAVWLFGLLGITTSLGVSIAPQFTPTWLYPRIVWGGLWGLLFFLTGLTYNPFLKGLLLSIGPTLVQLFVVFPFKAQKGMMGLDLGALTPIFVILFNAIWGVVAAYWIDYISERRRSANF